MKKPLLNTLLEDTIIEHLVDFPRSAQELQSCVSKTYSVSVQGLYKSLRSLLRREIILKQGKIYRLNNVWVNKVISLLDQKSDFVLLENESIVYNFSSIEQVDLFWKHIQHDFSFLKNTNDTILYYLPHQFWWMVPGRRESEKEFYQTFEKRSQRACVLLGNTTDLDILTKNEIQNTFVSVHASQIRKFRNNDSVTISQDHIITTHIPEKVYKKIDAVYQKKVSLSEKKLLLADILSRPISVRITISKNENLSKMYKDFFSKYFLI
jgi:hypothetical protein